MHTLDWIALLLYLAVMIGIGLVHARRQGRVDEYLVGDRKMGAGHLGLSIVATDVGGGFSIGLGGLGFTMGISGSWLLFTGLVGAWMAAVIVIPRVKDLGDRHGWLTFPDFLEHRFDARTRLTASVVSGLGYAGFVGAQVLAGAKLSSVAFGIDTTSAVIVMAVVVVAYTALGGLQAVVATDTVQWIVLLAGLLVAVPYAVSALGGLDAVRAALPAGHLSLANVGALELVGWAATIVPIWFVGMTLYQRIYAARDVRTARRAFYLAGLLEWPGMAFAGAALGMLARVAFPQAEAELGLPLLLREVLPAGVAGLVLAAYFAAIMSTADSCLLASVGHAIGDVWLRHIRPGATSDELLRLARLATIAIGGASVVVALALPGVLDAILLAYAFMVSGLFVPTLAGLLWPRATPAAALASMLTGGVTAVALGAMPELSPVNPPVLFCIPVSALVLVVVSLARPAPSDAAGLAAP